MAGKDECIIQTLLSYKKLCEQINNHIFLLQDKTILLYVATLLENKNRVQLSLCLDIIETIIKNESSHSILIATFGLFEAIESLAIRSKNCDAESYERCTEILNVLRKTAPPAYSTRSRIDQRKMKKKTSLFLILFEDLTEDNKKDLENALLEVKGVISFVFNNEYCTIRINARISIKVILKKIWLKCNTKGLIVSKNGDEKTETYIDVLNDMNCTPPAEYFPEEDSFALNNPITQRFVSKHPTSWLKSVKDTWSKAFYW